MNKTINISTNIRYIFEYGLVLIVVFLLENLSAKTIYRLGCLLGNLAYILATKRKRIALVNLNIAFGDRNSKKKKKQTIKNSFTQVALSLLQSLWVLNHPDRVNQWDLIFSRNALNEAKVFSF